MCPTNTISPKASQHTSYNRLFGEIKPPAIQRSAFNDPQKTETAYQNRSQKYQFPKHLKPMIGRIFKIVAPALDGHLIILIVLVFIASFNKTEFDRQ